jgi:GNAT superfamily N-acetyltransferase
MSRAHVVVRLADESACDDIAELWAAYRAELGNASEDAARRSLTTRVQGLLARPGIVAYLASDDDGAPVGYVLLSDVCPTPLVEHSTVSIEQLYVVKSLRKQGIARQLLTAATAYADRLGAEQILSNVPSQGREANRFFARLGFTPTVVRRVVPTAVLRRRLSPDQERSSIEQLLRRRRSARLRTAQAATVVSRTGVVPGSGGPAAVASATPSSS